MTFTQDIIGDLVEHGLTEAEASAALEAVKGHVTLNAMKSRWHTHTEGLIPGLLTTLRLSVRWAVRDYLLESMPEHAAIPKLTA